MIDHHDPDVRLTWHGVGIAAILASLLYWGCGCNMLGEQQIQKLSDEMEVSKKQTEKRIEDLRTEMINEIKVKKETTDNSVRNLHNSAGELTQQILDIKQERNEYVTQSTWQQFKEETRINIEKNVQNSFKLSQQQQTNEASLIIGIFVTLSLFGLGALWLGFSFLRSLKKGTDSRFS